MHFFRTCQGSLINRYTVLTAAHCIVTEFSQVIGSNTYTISVTNPYNAAQYSVFVGVYNNTFISTNSFEYPTVKMNVWQVIRVRNLQNEQFLLVHHFHFSLI